MTAFRPGQSPPPVRTPIRIDPSLRSRPPLASVPTHNGRRAAQLSDRADPLHGRPRRKCARQRPVPQRTPPVPERAGIHLLDPHRAARPHGPASREARPRRRCRRQRRSAARGPAAPDRRPGPAGGAGARAPAEDRRRRAAGVPHRGARPARHGCGRPRLPRSAGCDGELRPRSAAGHRSACLRGEARSAAAVLRDGRRRGRFGVACGGRSASTASWSTASRTAPTSASGTRWLIPRMSRSSCSTRSCRTKGRPISAWTSSAAPRRVLRDVCGNDACTADLAAAVRTHRPGAGDLRCADAREHRRPDVPLHLRRAARCCTSPPAAARPSSCGS